MGCRSWVVLLVDVFDRLSLLLSLFSAELVLWGIGAGEGIRTPDGLLGRQVLYQPELLPLAGTHFSCWNGERQKGVLVDCEARALIDHWCCVCCVVIVYLHLAVTAARLV